jgi:hypothetical protein
MLHIAVTDQCTYVIKAADYFAARKVLLDALGRIPKCHNWIETHDPDDATTTPGPHIYLRSWSEK